MIKLFEEEGRLLRAIRQSPESKLAAAYRLGRKTAMVELNKSSDYRCRKV